ncbi:MAG: L7Ae/L30e/S12e/Gadd45 family ribosomal protein [Gemmatimonadota bacterium]
MKTKERRDALRLLGLARRGGGVVIGTDASRAALREGRARLVLVAGDASPVQVEKIKRLLTERSVPQVILGDRGALGAAVGKGPVSVVAVTAAPMAAELAKRLGAKASPGPVEE